MKHLITRLLLVMICACAIPTAGNAFTLTIAGKANFMDSETVQSPEDSWKTNFVSQTISGDTGDFYFWQPEISSFLKQTPPLQAGKHLILMMYSRLPKAQSIGMEEM